MKLQKLRAAALALLLLAGSSRCFADSLFSGLKQGPRPVPLPKLGLAAPPNFQNRLTQALQGPLPQAPRLPAGAAIPGQAPTSETPLGRLQDARDKIAQSPQAGDGPAQNALERLFDAGGQGVTSFLAAAPPAADVEGFVARAKGFFHPALLPGQEAAVAAALKPRPEGAPSGEEMRSRVALSPLTNPEREAVVRKLFLEAGAKPEDIQIQDAGRNRHNIYVVKRGRTDRVIIVGGHHDKVSEGAGTIDNWTGATMVANLYQTMRDADTDATYVFIAFAREEEGLIGSEKYLESLSQEQRGKVQAMINLDTLAVDGTYSWKNNSTRALLDLIARLAARERLSLIEAFLEGGDADSSTFLKAGIAAMTVFGASPEIIFDIIHSERDTIAAFSLPHYTNCFFLTWALLKALDLAPSLPAGHA